MIFGICNLCGFPIVRINESIFGTRCLRCRSTQIHRAIGLVLQSLNFKPEISVYELSSRGAFFHYLKGKFKNLTFSEFYDDTSPGEYKGETQCQDVQSLTFKDETFDLVTSTEVFEHVPDDLSGFSEIHRILKPGGSFIFTVPLQLEHPTVERVCKKPDGNLEYLKTPAWHGDRIRGKKKYLFFGIMARI